MAVELFNKKLQELVISLPLLSFTVNVTSSKPLFSIVEEDKNKYRLSVSGQLPAVVTVFFFTRRIHQHDDKSKYTQ